MLRKALQEPHVRVHGSFIDEKRTTCEEEVEVVVAPGAMIIRQLGREDHFIGGKPPDLASIHRITNKS